LSTLSADGDADGVAPLADALVADTIDGAIGPFHGRGGEGASRMKQTSNTQRPTPNVEVEQTNTFLGKTRPLPSPQSTWVSQASVAANLFGFLLSWIPDSKSSARDLVRVG
jgi:hypothetical protein